MCFLAGHGDAPAPVDGDPTSELVDRDRPARWGHLKPDPVVAVTSAEHPAGAGAPGPTTGYSEKCSLVVRGDGARQVADELAAHLDAHRVLVVRIARLRDEGCLDSDSALSWFGCAPMDRGEERRLVERLADDLERPARDEPSVVRRTRRRPRGRAWAMQRRTTVRDEAVGRPGRRRAGSRLPASHGRSDAERRDADDYKQNDNGHQILQVIALNNQTGLTSFVRPFLGPLSPGPAACRQRPAT